MILREQCYSFALLHERLEQFVKFVALSVLLLVSALCTLLVIVHYHNPGIVETSMYGQKSAGQFLTITIYDEP